MGAGLLVRPEEVVLSSDLPRLRLWVVAAVGMALTVAIVAVHRAKDAFPYEWATWEERSFASDLDGDGRQEDVTLSGRSVTLRGEGVSWESDPAWLVSDAHVGDLDGDGLAELVLVVWKRGSFGTYRPFWVEEDDDAWSQHVFVFQLREGQVKPIWMSSAVPLRIVGSGLVDGLLTLTDLDGSQTDWEWQSWGFTLVGERAAGESPAGGEDMDSGEELSVVVVGDCIAHDAVLSSSYDYASGSYDFSPVFAQVAPWVSSFDVAIVTQETPLVDDAARASAYPLFATPAAMADALAGAGFDVVASATNHALDQGVPGIDETLSVWSRHPEVTVLGIHGSPDEAWKPALIAKKGFTIALFDACYGLNGQALPEGEGWRVNTLDDRERLIDEVREAATVADVTLCVLHVGEEYAESPSESQQALERELVEAGADAVFCSHGHVLQGMESARSAEGNEAVIYHGLGNFVATQYDARCLLGGAACLTFGRSGDGRAELRDHELVGTVCHFATGSVEVYLLNDYTDELAQAHYLSMHGDEGFSLESLYAQLDAAR